MALVWYSTATVIGAVTLFVLMPISIVLVPVACILSAVQARQYGYTNWLYYGLAGAVSSLHLLLPWLHISLRLSGKVVNPRLVRAVYAIALVVWAVYLVNGYVLLGIITDISPVFWLVLYAGTVAFVMTFVMLVRNSNPDQRRKGRQRTETAYRHRVQDFAYLIPFTFLIIHPLALFWEVFSSS